jgi:hypothetical protein
MSRGLRKEDILTAIVITMKMIKSLGHVVLKGKC